MDMLLEPLLESIRETRRQDPLSPVHVVAPNPTVEQFLRFRIAERLGIAANLKFGALTTFMAQCVRDAPEDIELLGKDALQLLILGCLKDPIQLQHPEMVGVRTYLDVAHTADERSLRLYQLSAETARLFEEYGFNRPEMLREWPRRTLLSNTDWADAERWQRRLYLTLFDGKGQLRRPAHTPSNPDQMDLFGPPPTAVPMMSLVDAVRSLTSRLPLPPRIHIFGVSYLAQTFAELIYQMSTQTEVHIYALNPCFAFWEDVVKMNPKETDRSRWIQHGETIGGNLEGEDPFSLDGAGDTPALRLWGRPGREFIRLLNEMTGCEFVSRFRDTPGTSVLHRLKRDILIRAPEGKVSADSPAGTQRDESITIIGAPTLRREVEIVADHIWSEIKANAEGAGEHLRFHEIAVLVTDAERARYLAHLDAVFRQRHGIPFNMIDRRMAGQSRVLEAISRLLELPTSGFSYDAMMAVLTHPCVGGGVASDLDRWRQWCDQLNILFGADADDLAGTYLDSRIHHWDQGLRRLSQGVFLAGERSGVETVFETEDGMWLPHETPPDAAADVSRLVSLARRLIADARQCLRAEMSVADWAALFVHLIQTYVVTDDLSEETAMGKCTAAFERLGQDDLLGTPVGFIMARELARQALSGLDRGRGQHQADGVVISSLQPMRAIPFRRVYVLGLSEGVFPTPMRQEPLDLRRARRRAADVSGGERDRYLFLETLLSTQEKLVLSYVSRDAHSGESLEPSSVIRELQYILRGYLPPEALAAVTIQHPLRATDSRYQTDAALAQPMTTSVGLGRAAQALRSDLETHLGGTPPALIWPVDRLSEAAITALAPVLGRVPPEEVKTPEVTQLSLRQLRNFLESPLQGSAKFHLGFSGYTIPGDADEPLEIGTQLRRSLLNESMWAGGGDWDTTIRAYDTLRERQILKGDLPVGTFGELARAKDLRELKLWLEALAPHQTAPLSEWTRARFGRGDERGEVQNAWPAIVLDVPMSSGESRLVELSGTLPPLEPDGRRSLRFTTNSAIRERTHLQDFLTLMALSASGRPPAGHFEAMVTKQPGKTIRGVLRTKRFQPPTPDEARRWLTTVTADLLSGLHAYRMPADIALTWGLARRRAEDGVVEAPEASKDILDTYGPIHSPERFPVPDTDTLADYAERRFGHWFDLDLDPPKDPSGGGK